MLYVGGYFTQSSQLPLADDITSFIQEKTESGDSFETVGLSCEDGYLQLSNAGHTITTALTAMREVTLVDETYVAMVVENGSKGHLIQVLTPTKDGPQMSAVFTWLSKRQLASCHFAKLSLQSWEHGQLVADVV